MSGYEDSYVDYYDYDSSDSYYDNSGSSSISLFSWFRQSNIQSSQRDYSYRIEEARRQAEREYQQRLRPLEKRQQQFESSLNNLSSNIGRVEREMVQRDTAMQHRLQQQRQDLTKQIRQQRDETQRQFQHQRIEYRRLINEQGQRMMQLAKEERQQRIQAFNRLQQQINDITADAARRQSIASSFVADLSKLTQGVSVLPHERFAPGELELIQRHVKDARSSLDAGMPEASLSTAQNAYWQLTDLRSLVLQRESEFLMLHQAALEEVRTILEEARAHRQCEINPERAEDGEKLQFEVDYWTRGELGEFEKELHAVERKLIAAEKTLTTEDVKNILVSLEEAESKLIRIVNRARDNVIDSQLRLNTAEMVIDALATQGFDVEAGVYEGNDQRNAYVAKVKNRAETEIVTVISPVPERSGRCRVSIHSYDETFVGEEVLRERAQEVVRLLSEEGLQVAPSTCRGAADQSYRDLSKVATRQPVAATAQLERPSFDA